MKNISLLFFLFYSLVQHAQVDFATPAFGSPEMESYFEQAKPAKVTGKVLNNGGEERLVKFVVNVPFIEYQKTYNFYTNENGTFQVELSELMPYQSIYLMIDTFFFTSLLINDSLHVEVDADYLIYNGGGRWLDEGISYYGADAEMNTYLLNNLKFKQKTKWNLEDQALDLARKISDLNREKKDTRQEYKALEKVTLDLYRIDSVYISNNPSVYRKIIENNRQSDNYKFFMYANYGTPMDQQQFDKIKNHKVYFASSEGLGFYYNLWSYVHGFANGQTPVDWEGLKHQYSKTTTTEKVKIDSFLYHKSIKDKKLAFDTLAYGRFIKDAYGILGDTISQIHFERALEVVDSLFPPAKADFLKLSVGAKDVSTQKLFYQIALSSMRINWCKALLENELERKEELVRSMNETISRANIPPANANFGEPVAQFPFEAKLYQVDNISSDDFLHGLIANFNDKAIIIDFWATWCGPCIMDMKKSKDFIENTKDLPVAFIYICTSSGSNIDIWKNKIVELEKSGIHIFVDERIVSELFEKLGLSGYPSYAFFDQAKQYYPGVVSFIADLNRKQLEELVNK